MILEGWGSPPGRPSELWLERVTSLSALRFADKSVGNFRKLRIADKSVGNFRQLGIADKTVGKFDV